MRRFAESGDDALRLAIKCEVRVQACSVNTRAGVWSHARVYSRSIRGVTTLRVPALTGRLSAEAVVIASRAPPSSALSWAEWHGGVERAAPRDPWQTLRMQVRASKSAWQYAVKIAVFPC